MGGVNATLTNLVQSDVDTLTESINDIADALNSLGVTAQAVINIGGNAGAAVAAEVAAVQAAVQPFAAPVEAYASAVLTSSAAAKLTVTGLQAAVANLQAAVTNVQNL